MRWQLHGYSADAAWSAWSNSLTCSGGVSTSGGDSVEGVGLVVVVADLNTLRST